MSEAHGDHWKSLVHDTDRVIDEFLPFIIENGELEIGSKTTLPMQYDAAGNIVDEPHEEMPFGMRYDAGPFSMLSVIVANGFDRSMNLWTAYPFLSKGETVTLEVCDIKPWENGIEAEVEGETEDGCLLSFFDLYYFRDHSKYKAGDKIEVELGAMAFDVQQAQKQTFIIDDPERVRELREILGDEDDTGPLEVSTEGMACLLPIEASAWNSFEYMFQGPVKSVETVLGHGMVFYRTVVTVIRVEEDFDLPILIGKHVIEDNPPQVGDDVTGHLWLHGEVKGR